MSSKGALKSSVAANALAGLEVLIWKREKEPMSNALVVFVFFEVLRLTESMKNRQRARVTVAARDCVVSMLQNLTLVDQRAYSPSGLRSWENRVGSQIPPSSRGINRMCR